MSINEIKTERLSVDETIEISGLKLSYVQKNTNYTLTLSDYSVEFDCSSASLIATLPLVPDQGQIVNINKSDASLNSLLIDGNGNNINGNISVSTNSQYTNFQLQYNGTQWRIL